MNPLEEEIINRFFVPLLISISSVFCPVFAQAQSTVPEQWVDYSSGEYEKIPNIAYSTASSTDPNTGVPNKLVTIQGGKHDSFNRRAPVNRFAIIREFLRKNNIITKE